MRKFSAAVALLCLLTACGEEASSEPSDEGGAKAPYLYSQTVTLKDGQVVECVFTYYVNALWCTPSEGSDY